MAGKRTDILMNTLEKLQDANAAVRKRTLRALRRTLGPAELAQPAKVVIALLEDTERCVRVEAVITLHKLEPATFAQHAGAVVAKLDIGRARLLALRTLGKLDQVTLAQHAGAVAARLEDSNEDVRGLALATLS